MNYFLESCCTSAADAVTAQRFGARRIELCSRLDIGGVTPSESLIRATLLALAEDFLTASLPEDPLTVSCPANFLAASPASLLAASPASLPEDSLPASLSEDSLAASCPSVPASPSSTISAPVPDRHSASALNRHSELDRIILPYYSATPIPVNVLVRPRGGDFVYTEDEIQQIITDIGMCKRLCVRDSSGREHRVNGVVVGALRADGGIDMAAMRRLVAAARPLQITFHRAFDECSDLERGLEDVIALGCDRLLTSGHEPDAFAGRFTLARLVRLAAGRIVILAGCGVRPHNIAAIASASSAPEFHSSTLTGW